MPNPSFISPFGDRAPRLHPEAYVDVSARIIGDVVVAAGASIWPMAVLRADSGGIEIRGRAAVLDLALVEAPGGVIVLEEEALISHGAMIHGARVGARSLIGIGAIVLDGAVIGSGSIVGAGSLITPGTVIPPNSLVLGSPGRVVRETSPQERETILGQIEELFIKSRRYLAQERDSAGL